MSLSLAAADALLLNHRVPTMLHDSILPAWCSKKHMEPECTPGMIYYKSQIAMKTLNDLKIS